MTGLVELPVYRAKIEPHWIDYNGHLRDAYYALVASLAVDDVMDNLGLDAAYRARTLCTLYTLEVHLHYLHEVKESDQLAVRTQILDFDRKRIHAGCLFSCARVSDSVASAEMMLLHVQQASTPASTPFPDAVMSVLQDLRRAATSGAAFGPGSRKIELKRR